MIMYLQQSEPMLITVADPTLSNVKVSRKRSRSQIKRTTSDAAPETKKRRVVKSVGFASIVQTMSPTSSTTSANWYNEKDASRFHANMKRDVVYLAQRCKTNTVATMDRTEYCSFGLERFCCSAENRAQSKQAKQRTVRAVLDMQYGQRQVGVSDPEAIQRAAQQLSLQAVDRALLLAARLC